MQQPRTEGVDGLHLESARRLQRQREQSPGARAQRRVRRDVRDSANGGIERCVVERGPPAQLIEHAVRHIGGGGLGEGDAENLRRIDAVEQQADHALREHVGLAGAGIGGHPGRDRGSEVSI